MLNAFLSHQWKAFWRSKNRGVSIAAQIFLAFAVLYLLVIACLAGFSMGPIIDKLFPGKDVFKIFNGFILYYFAIDFIARLQLQELPVLRIVPYLHLRIPRDKLVTFLNIRSLFNAFNLLPLFIFIPFCSTAISNVYGISVMIMYIISILSLCILNNYTALYIKRLTTVSIKFTIGLAVTIAIAASLEYFKIFSIAKVSDIVFSIITLHPLLGFAFTIAATIMFMVNSRYLANNLYIETLNNAREKKISTDYPLLDRFGAAGTLAALEVKLIFRHKRTRSSIFISLFFIFYGFIFYKRPMLENDQIQVMIFAAVFMTGSSISMYGQFMFGWQAAHFDGLLANKMKLKAFINAKFILFTTISTAVTLLTTFYGFISWKILYIQFAAYLYNIGIGTVIVLYFATTNYKAIDLSKTASFNYQGVSASQFILLIPYLLSPYLFFLPFSLAGHPYWGVASLGIFGFISLLMRNFWIKFLVKALNNRKYKIAEGFRES